MAWTARRRSVQPGLRQNPFFRRQPSARRAWIIVVSGIICLVLFGFFLWFPLWRFQEVKVAGASPERQEEIIARARVWLKSYSYGIIPNGHRWFWSKVSCETFIQENKNLGFAVCDADGPTLLLSVGERARLYYYLSDDDLSSLDADGHFIESVDELERARLLLHASDRNEPLLITDRRQTPVAREPTVSADEWQTLQTILLRVRADAFLTVTGIDLRDERTDIHTSEGPVIYVSLLKPAEEQSEKLLALMRRELVDLSTIGYIDLRYTNRLYYH